MLSLPNSLQCRPNPVFPKNYTALTCTFPIVNRKGIVFYFLCNKKLTILQIHLYGRTVFLWNLSHSCLENKTDHRRLAQESMRITKWSVPYGKKFIQLRNNFKSYKILQNQQNGTTRQYHCYCHSTILHFLQCTLLLDWLTITYCHTILFLPSYSLMFYFLS